MKISEIVACIENIAPLPIQESYDNAGLITGNYDSEVSSLLITIDVTEEVIDEAINNKDGLIVAHHPITLKGLKHFNGNNYVERCIIKAIKNDIAIYVAHTNLDSVHGGVNSKICEKIGLQECKILSPAKDQLLKLVTFIPADNMGEVRMALFNAGAGHIGNYDQCSFYANGTGTFQGNEKSNPHVGKKGELHLEKEVRLETVLPLHLKGEVLRALIESHPYEEPAFDFYPLANELRHVGGGMIGKLPKPEPEKEFLLRMKKTFNCGIIKHTDFLDKPVQKVAVCGGSGSFLLPHSISAKADIFITGDIKYHQFFDAEKKIVVADIGHFESEQFTKDIFHEILTKKFPTFALHLSKVKTSPINYL